MTQVSTIGQISMNVKDLARAIEFYRDRLGIPFLFEAPPALAFLDCDGVRLLLDVPQDKEFDQTGSILYFSVDDIARAHADHGPIALRGGAACGGMPRFSPEERNGWRSFDDTEGNTLALMSEVRI